MPIGKAYCDGFGSNSFSTSKRWLTGIESSAMRVWVAPNFKCDPRRLLHISRNWCEIAGDQKLTPVSALDIVHADFRQRYSFLSEPSERLVCRRPCGTIAGTVASAGMYIRARALHSAVDYYYNLGALVNVYSHILSTGEGDADNWCGLHHFSMNTNFASAAVVANAVGVYQWWRNVPTR